MANYHDMMPCSECNKINTATTPNELKKKATDLGERQPGLLVYQVLFFSCLYCSYFFSSLVFKKVTILFTGIMLTCLASFNNKLKDNYLMLTGLCMISFDA